MLLRRYSRIGNEPISLRFNLVNENGINCGKPNNIFVTGEFPDGSMYWTITGNIFFSFPNKGDYRLDIISDEEKLPFIYNYNIEIN
jgi:hypothetical protein